MPDAETDCQSLPGPTGTLADELKFAIIQTFFVTQEWCLSRARIGVRPSHSDWGLKEGLDVHRPVRDADDCDNARLQNIKKQMGSLAVAPIALTHVISGSAGIWIFREPFKSFR